MIIDESGNTPSSKAPTFSSPLKAANGNALSLSLGADGSATGAGASGAGGLTVNKFIKNTTRFYDQGVSEVLNNVLLRYIDSPLVAQWACRAINNLTKSHRLKTDFLDKGILDTVHGITERYSMNAEVIEWANLAKESLTATNDY